MLQYKHALQLLLPSSPIYDILEDTLPHPSQTYLQLIKISESDEKEFINREIGERRTRLGARIDQVTLEVKREAFQRSDLEGWYHGLIDWTCDDDIRRNCEEKLLTRAHEELQVLPSGKKEQKRQGVLQSARDMVVIKHPFELAWKIVLEWNDIGDLSELDVNLLRDFVEIFPNDGLSNVLKGYLSSNISPFELDAETLAQWKDEESSAKEDPTVITDKHGIEEQLLVMAEGLDKVPSSILAHRIMGQVYLLLEEFQATVNVSRNALPIIAQLQRATGLKFRNIHDSVNITLATALISYQSPRNHPEAKGIFEEILKRKPSSTPCLLGIGLILEEDQDYAMAVDFLENALQRDPDNMKIRSELFWCKAHNGALEDALAGLQETLSFIQSAQSEYKSNLKAEVLYRIGYCIWELNPESSARKDREGAYASFLRSIQTDMDYAPAYTYLGKYYADYKKDQKRARRCFHKAFELSPTEFEAARRLAQDVAGQGDWDLVEAIARRVVDTGRARPAPGSKREGHAWPYAALGVVEINRQQYTKSIVSFQAALRISPDNYQCWIGLGESYYNSGRYISATKAFQHAESLEEILPAMERDQIWFAKYMMANVQRDLGQYEDAISRYKGVLELRPNEYGVSIALLQTLSEAAWKAVESGLFGEAAETARGAILTGISIAKQHQNAVNLWKAIGDAFSYFSWIKGKASLAPIAEFKEVLETEVDATAIDSLVDVDNVGSSFETLFDDNVKVSNRAVYATILAYKLALSISASDKHSHAVAWYNLGWAEYRGHQCWEHEDAGSEKRHGFLKASMRCFKRAIELEAGNAEFWNALGVATTNLSPKVAQHSFVRSLHINDRSPQVWTNLGALYLLHNDYQLANEAFTRGQSADPDFAQAWLGQGFLALLYGDVTEARELFKHAYTLGNASVVVPKRHYALCVFDEVRSDAATTDIPQLIQPLFALHQLHTHDPSNTAFERLSGLIAERILDFNSAEQSLENTSFAAEAEFESSESTSALFRYAQAKADIARVQLGQLGYERAVDSAETALSLSDDTVAEVDLESYECLRLSAHLTAGLAYYSLKHMDKSIEMFREALREASNDPDVVCLLAQVLWAKGGEEERNVAREQLFDCVEKNPDHIGAVTLLGAIAVLDSDNDAIEAVESDLHNMRTGDDIDIHSRAKITQLLAGISSLGLGRSHNVPEDWRRVHEASNSVMLSPEQPEGWMALSAASAERYPAEMAIETALRNIPPRGTLDAVSLGKAYVHTGWREDALRGIMVAPWKKEGWTEFNHCMSEA